MKFNLSLALALILALMVSCSGGTNDLDKYGLKGNVKEVKELQCDATYENEQWVASSNCEQGFRVLEFDTDGNYVRSMTIADRGDTLAMTIAILIQDQMGDFYSSMFVTSGIFGLWMYVAGAISIYAFKKVLPVEDAPDEEEAPAKP